MKLPKFAGKSGLHFRHFFSAGGEILHHEGSLFDADRANSGGARFGIGFRIGFGLVTLELGKALVRNGDGRLADFERFDPLVFNQILKRISGEVDRAAFEYCLVPGSHKKVFQIQGNFIAGTPLAVPQCDICEIKSAAELQVGNEAPSSLFIKSQDTQVGFVDFCPVENEHEW